MNSEWNAEQSGEQSPDAPAKPLEIVSDEDWKSRVKAEDAALDEQLRQEQSAPNVDAKSPAEPEQPSRAEPQSTHEEEELKLPPASFPMLISMFSTQAMVSLGLIPNPLTGKAEPELILAKHYIDLLSVLEEKTVGNLEAQEKRMLGDSLHELRMLYVQQTRAASGASTSGDERPS